MGKVSKPLTIVVFSPLDEWPEIEKLEKQGHTIVKLSPLPNGYTSNIKSNSDVISLIVEADIILGPRCWYMTPLHRKHLTDAIKQARLRRYGTIAKKRKKGDKDEDTEEHTDPSSTDPEPTGC